MTKPCPNWAACRSLKHFCLFKELCIQTIPRAVLAAEESSISALRQGRMSTSRLLSSHYRSFLRLVGKFNREHIPLLRVSELAVDTDNLNPRTTVRATFRSEQAIGPAISSAAFGRLTQQFDILLHAEDRTKEVTPTSTDGLLLAEHRSALHKSEASQRELLLQAFGTWQNLLSRYGQVRLCQNTVSRAVEDAALVLPDLASGEAAWSVFDTVEEEETGM